jgi:pimeloyl-ACP methyl ester carboxylesterase
MVWRILYIFSLLLCGHAALAQTYQEAPCPSRLLIGRDTSVAQSLRCGILSVPEDRTNALSRSIDLAVLILPSLSEIPAEPVVFLQGGPGGASLATLPWWLESPLRDHHDIILIDQRGTGYSRPSLSCPELTQTDDAVAAMRACRMRLERTGINLSAYNSRENARDIQDLRAALGLEAVNLLGVSYGSRLALTILRDNPEGIRSVILDSVYPPQVERMVGLGPNFLRVLSEVFRSCRAQPECAAQYPELERNFYAAIAELNDAPLPSPLLPIDGSLLLTIFFQAMYQTQIGPYLPYSMQRFSEGDYLTTLALLAGIEAEALGDIQLTIAAFLRLFSESFRFLFANVQSEGAYFSTECQEDILFQTPEAIRRKSGGLPEVLQGFVDDSASDLFAVCTTWGVARGDMTESQAVSSDIPTLLLAGTFDPITPPVWAELAARTLTNSTLVVLPGVAHGAFDANDCAEGIVLEFLAHPHIPPDTSCVSELTVSFYVP